MELSIDFRAFEAESRWCSASPGLVHEHCYGRKSPNAGFSDSLLVAVVGKPAIVGIGRPVAIGDQTVVDASMGPVIVIQNDKRPSAQLKPLPNRCTGRPMGDHSRTVWV